MTDSLKILLVSAECDPYVKVGGLGDVTGNLPRYIKKLGHQIIIVIPLYSLIDYKRYGINPAIEEMKVKSGNDFLTCRVHSAYLKDDVPAYFIDYEPYFGRDGIYHDKNFNDYQDNPLRFTFLSKAALELCRVLNFAPDIVHANDWHTAVLAALLKRFCHDDPLFKSSASVLTIHNLAYQGMYDKYYFHMTGLGQEDFTTEKFECFDAVNFLKGGIYFADMVNTVSKGYVGILNGAEYSLWDPSIDPFIPANYTRNDLKGKNACKRALQNRMGMNTIDNEPVIGIIGRFAEQKGFYILSECLEALISGSEVQFAVLGSGDNQIEAFFSDLHHRYPGNLGLYTGFSEELAHLIEAGSDFFLMPSLYEPCGLNQIYSLRYGTLPVVRATGGLNDTVENYNPDTGEGTGFKFQEASCKAIYNTLNWVIDTYLNRKEHIAGMIQRAMIMDFSWESSAAEYVSLYVKALQNRESPQ
jgi:starch synthase